LAGDIDAGVIVVTVLRRIDPVAGEDERRLDLHGDAALPCQREVGGQDVLPGVGSAPGRDCRHQLRLGAIDVRLRHRERLEKGPAIADRLQTHPVEEGGDVVRGDSPLDAERIATGHLRCGQKNT
jgi:hypothetical protein